MVYAAGTENAAHWNGSSGGTYDVHETRLWWIGGECTTRSFDLRSGIGLMITQISFWAVSAGVRALGLW